MARASEIPHLGWSSHVYPLDAADIARTPDYDGPAIPAAALPDDAVLLYIRPDGPDALLRGRAAIDEALRADASAVVPVRVVFRPSVARWNLAATLVRVLRNRHRFCGTGRYHISAAAVRALGVERAVRTLDNPQKRGGTDRRAKMRELEENLRAHGYDDARPIDVMLCRTWGRIDSLHQGHHRVSACLACGVRKMCVGFSAAGALPAAFGRVRKGNGFARDVFRPAARPADEWRHGAPCGGWWTAVSAKEPFAEGACAPGRAPEVADRKVLVEGKFLNDAICSGTVGGTRCVVKHSTTAVFSIWNEYRLAARAYARAPEVVAMPVACWFSPAEHSAFVALEWIDGPSLSELLMREITERQADGFAADILKMSEMLLSSGIVHRDVFTDNLILGRDGHLKLIDWQMGIARAAPREDPWVEAHWKFHYVVFGVNRDLPPGHWNDVRAFIAVLDMLPGTRAVRRAKEALSKRIREADFVVRPPLRTRLALAGYAVSLLAQMLVRGKGEKRDRIKRRLLTVLGRGSTDVDGRDPARVKEGRA